MPILGQENDIYPANLLTDSRCLENDQAIWYSVYTLSRREKDLMRKLYSQKIRFYGPVITKRFRSPGGRMRTSYVPLFPNYVFMLATEDDRYQAMTTNCISQCTPVPDPQQLVEDLQRIANIIAQGEGLTPEARLEAGQPVRVKSGPFAGYEGRVIRREGKTRFLLAVKFLEQGISIAMDEAMIDPL